MKLKRHISIWKIFIVLMFSFLSSCDWIKTLKTNQVTNSKTLIMTVAPEYKTCHGVGQQKCLYVSTDGGEFELLYTSIKGFYRDHTNPPQAYKESYEYVIKVKRSPVANPPTDTSSLRYELIDILSKTRK